MTEFRSARRARHRLSGLARFAALPVLAFGLALSGCAGQANTEALVKSRLEAQNQQLARTQANEYQSIIAELRQTTMCVTTAEKRPEFKILQAHGSNDGDSPPPPQKLVDRHKASAKERKLIVDFLQAMASCRPKFGTFAIATNRNIARVISDTWDAQQELYGELKEGKIAWGAFNRGTRSNSDKLSGALQSLRLTNEG